MSGQAAAKAIRRKLEEIVPLRRVELRLPQSGALFHLLQPADLDRLLDRVEHDPEQNLPYWAELWPSGIALADAITAQPEQFTGLRVLELGCGMGVTAAAALRAGALLTAVDYFQEALMLTRYHGLVNAGAAPETLQLNWRAAENDLLQSLGGRFPMVLAADVLYESRDVEPLIDMVEELVASGGLLWLAEPGRAVARRFVEGLRERGWEGREEQHQGPWSDPRDAGVKVMMYRLRRKGKGKA